MSFARAEAMQREATARDEASRQAQRMLYQWAPATQLECGEWCELYEQAVVWVLAGYSADELVVRKNGVVPASVAKLDDITND